MRLELIGAADWQALQRAEPYLAWGVQPSSPSSIWLSPSGTLVAIARRRRSSFPSSLTFIRRHSAGSQPLGAVASELAAMVTEAAPELRPGGLTVPRQLAVPVYRELRSWLQPADPGGPIEGIGWDWMWTDRRPSAEFGQRAAQSVTRAGLAGDWLDAGDAGTRSEVQALLDATSPRHSAKPGDARVRRWYGLRGPGGQLVACAAWYESVPGIPLLASVAVRAGHRGRGLGGALMVSISEAAFEAGCPAVTVDLYADNDQARRLYRRLGFVLEQEFASWALAGLGTSRSPGQSSHD